MRIDAAGGGYRVASFRLNFTLMLNFTLILSAFAMVAGFALSPAASAQQREQSSPPRNSKEGISEIIKGISEAADKREDNARDREIRFSRGSAKDLYAARMDQTMARIERSTGAEDQTKVWIAHADVASLPGLETIVHVKNPVSCGSLGCELVIMGEIDGKKTVLLRTICETITSLAQDKLVMNQGSKYEMTWVFDGAKFIQRK